MCRAAERDQICEHYLALMGLSDFANSYPKHLSGGMRQRLAIARAYAVKPQFLLMDEPFGALDAQTRANMQNLLLKVLATEGKTVMLITHSVEEAIYLASRIVVVTARPARIKEIIDVPFAYPRDELLQERPEFGELRSHIRELVMSEYRAQQASCGRLHFRNNQKANGGNAMDRRQFLTTTLASRSADLRPRRPRSRRPRPRFASAICIRSPSTARSGPEWTAARSTKQGLDLELRQFNTGLEIFQALIGGSLDVLATGAVLSNFPARGQGKVFLINDIEVATAQLWVRSDQGIKSFEDLKGKRIATATGTTAHVFLDKALRANKIDPRKSNSSTRPCRPR